MNFIIILMIMSGAFLGYYIDLNEEEKKKLKKPLKSLWGFLMFILILNKTLEEILISLFF